MADADGGVYAWSQGVDSSTLPSEELNAQVAPIIREMNGYLLEHIRARRRRPADDLIGRLTDAWVDGDGLKDEDIVGFAGEGILLDRYREIAVDPTVTEYHNPCAMLAPRRLPVRVPADVSARAS